jgi:hypothetical protein
MTICHRAPQPHQLEVWSFPIGSPRSSHWVTQYDSTINLIAHLTEMKALENAYLTPLGFHINMIGSTVAAGSKAMELHGAGCTTKLTRYNVRPIWGIQTSHCHCTFTRPHCPIWFCCTKPDFNPQHFTRTIQHIENQTTDISKYHQQRDHRTGMTWNSFMIPINGESTWNWHQ